MILSLCSFAFGQVVLAATPAISIVSLDEAYQGFQFPDLNVLIKDNDKVGVLILKPKN